jgi:hypothetical protein
MICLYLPYIETTLIIGFYPILALLIGFLVVQKSLHGNVKKRLSTITV